ncbi:MAG: cytochrome P450 [Xanthomonadales bacterium]|nr:cytochrome P450 [Xanthomonadales bacterium]
MAAIDLYADSFFQDPYPTYQKMRELKTCYWLENHDRTSFEGVWMVSRYADVVKVLRSSHGTSVDVKRLVPEPQWHAFDYTLLFTDPPDHTRLRALISAPFSNAGVRQLEESITRIVDQLIDNLLQRGKVDFLQEFALPLPIKVISNLLGTPPEDSGLLRQWTSDLTRGLDSTVVNAEFLKNQGTVLKDMSQYFADLLGRAQQPSGTIIEQLVADTNAAACSPREALAHCLLLLLAGHETTIGMLCGGMFTLLSNPAEMEKLRHNPGLMDGAIDEMLRYETPFQRATFRVVTAPLLLSSQEIQRGERVSAVMGSANRDPLQFPHPDRFDISRKPNAHVSFGLGIHRCLGEKLARIEGRIAFTRLLQRLPAIELLDANPRWQRRSLFRALEALPLRLG